MAALRISLGVAVWALHFALVYGFTALACARGFGAAAPWVVGAATLVAAAAAIAIILAYLSREFIGWMTASVAALALVAIAWEGLAALFVQPCA
ncbi:MAG: hypothetical protein ACT4P3_04710 [Betaproteobacteria bacterium]